ncbi:Piwi-like protein 1 [Chamberlinius hualienensis]
MDPQGRGHGRGRAVTGPEKARRPGVGDPSAEAEPQQGRARGRVRARTVIPQDTTIRPEIAAERQDQPVQPPVAAAAIGAVNRGRVGRSAGVPPPTEQLLTSTAPFAATSLSTTEVAKMTSMLSLASGDFGGVRGGGGGGGVRGNRRGRRDEIEIHSRPPAFDKHGSEGTIIQLFANYFEILSTPSWAISQYHVDFSPDIEFVKTRRALLYVHKNLLGQFLFDGMQLFTANRLPSLETEVFSKRESDGANIQIKIKFIKEVSPRDPIVMQILSIQMRKNLRRLEFTLIGRQYYDKHQVSDIRGHNLQLWPGFLTAVHQHEHLPMLCADLTFKVLRTDTILDQLKQIAEQNYGRFREEATRLIAGQIVLTTYNNRTYRVDDIDWNRNPRATFNLRDGTTTTFIDYYKNSHNIDIRDHQQPLLISNRRKPAAQQQAAQPQATGDTEGQIILIPELCQMTGLSESTRSDYRIMKLIGEHTRGPPHVRVSRIANFLKRINSNKEIVEEMNGWNMAFSDRLTEFKGRLLPPEMITQGDGRPYTYDPNTADWSRESRSHPLYRCHHLKHWLVIASRNDAELANAFVHTLKKVGESMNLRINDPNMQMIDRDRPPDYLSKLQQTISRDTELVMFLFPNNRKDRYDAIKKHCCITDPVPSQVIVRKTVENPKTRMSVATKVAIQLNCKLGGAPWCTEIPMKNAMVIGYDSYHDSAKKNASVGAVCCSTDKSFTQYHSQASYQTSHQETVSGLVVSITAGLVSYHRLNKTLPDKIFIYRDGVGEGDLERVFTHELEQIQECFKKIKADYNPRMAFIVVTKRLNTRIFRRKTDREARADNPLPGTVVDDVITRPEWYDFFLVSQSVRQGTVAPTHYNVLYDTTNFKPNIMQRLTYKLTHLYYNWPGTLRVPAPCMYAHKLAFLIGQSLHQVPDSRLADTLYFL